MTKSSWGCSVTISVKPILQMVWEDIQQEAQVNNGCRQTDTEWDQVWDQCKAVWVEVGLFPSQKHTMCVSLFTDHKST